MAHTTWSPDDIQHPDGFSRLQTWMRETDNAISAANSGRLVYQTLAAANAAGGADGLWAEIVADSTSSNNGIYQRTGGAWVKRAGLIGSNGATGAQGPAGPAGATGATGATGPAGPTGATGSTGPAGPVGAAGPTGATGAKGDKGNPGNDGTDGDDGRDGYSADRLNRPGDNPLAFSSQTTGEGSSKPDLTGGTVQTHARLGKMYVVSGSAYVAVRNPTALKGLVVEVKARVKRLVNSADPSGDAVALRVVYLDKDKLAISSQAVATITNLTTSSGDSDGVAEMTARISALDVDGVTAPPANTAYVCAYVQTYGTGAQTAVITLEQRDVTDLHIAEIADLSQLVADVEAATAAANAAADLVATETLDTMASVATWTRPAGVGVISLKGGYAAHDGLGGQWAYDPTDTTSAANPPAVLRDAGTARFKPVLRRSRAIYLDSINGNDSNAGTSWDRAVQSVGAATAKLRDGDTLYLARNGVYFKLDMGGIRDLKVRPFGDGRRPICTGAREIPSGAWSYVAGSSNIYKATVTHTIPTANESNTGMNYGLWVDVGLSWEPGRLVGLRRVSDAGTLTAALAALQPGQFVARVVGQPDSNPGTIVGATQIEYYVRLVDETNPATGPVQGRVIRYAEAGNVANFGYGSDVEGIDFMRSAGKDHVGGGIGSGLGGVGRVHDCRFIDYHVHGCVMRCNSYTKVYFEGNGAADVPFSGTSLHLYRGIAFDGYSRGAWVDEAEFLHVASAIAVHGSGSDSIYGGWTHEAWEVGRVKITDCKGAIGGTSLAHGINMRIKELIVLGGEVGIDRGAPFTGGSDATTTIDHFIFVAKKNVPQIRVFNSNVHIKRGWCYIEQYTSLGASDRALLGRGFIGGGGYAKLENFTCVGGNFDSPAEGVNGLPTLEMRNCVMGDIGSKPMNSSYRLIATNTQLTCDRATLAAIQAIHPDVDDTCVSPYVISPVRYTVPASAVSESAAGTATTTAGATYFLASQSNLASNAAVSIAGADGSGGKLRLQGLARSAGNDSGGLYAYTAASTATMPATVSGAAVTLPRTTQDFFAAGVTARLLAADAYGTLASQDTYLVVADDTIFAVGQYVRLSGIPRVDANGWYKVAAKLGSTVNGLVIQVDRLIPWRLLGGAGGTYQHLGSANGQAGPDVSVSWPRVGFRTGPAVSGTVTYASGHTLAIDSNAGGAPGLLNPTIASAGVTTGSTNYLDAVTGRLPWRIRADVGDYISLDVKSYIEDFEPIFAGAWPHDLTPILRGGTECARRQMGYTAARGDVVAYT
jgi:hypothetical protein